jgi:hypothetical protein
MLLLSASSIKINLNFHNSPCIRKRKKNDANENPDQYFQFKFKNLFWICK